MYIPKPFWPLKRFKVVGLPPDQQHLILASCNWKWAALCHTTYRGSALCQSTMENEQLAQEGVPQDTPTGTPGPGGTQGLTGGEAPPG